jgi:hypothetical protein
MAATVVIAETNGPQISSVETVDPSNINMGSDDSAELVPATYPVTAQADGHAFEKWLRLFVSDMGGSSIVDNIKVWLSNLGGGYKTEEGMTANLRTTGYVQASYPSGGPIDTDSSVADQVMPVAEPASANIGIVASLSGQITSSPAYSDWIVLQLDLTENTPAGGLNQKTATIQFDEQ